MFNLTRRLMAATPVAAILVCPALAVSHQAGSARHRPSHHSKPASHMCASWLDHTYFTDYSRNHATGLSCTMVRSVETALARKLASGSGPRGPVREKVGKVKFTCRAKLHLEPNKMTGPGRCTASKHRSFTFVATVYGQ